MAIKDVLGEFIRCDVRVYSPPIGSNFNPRYCKNVASWLIGNHFYCTQHKKIEFGTCQTALAVDEG